MIEVTDDGRGIAVEPRVGHGLIGMRERVGLFGGTVETSARPGGGFVVRAEIPDRGPGVTIRIVVADDQALMRGGFRMILDAEDDLEVVGEAIDGTDAIRAVERAGARRRR